MPINMAYNIDRKVSIMERGVSGDRLPRHLRAKVIEMNSRDPLSGMTPYFVAEPDALGRLCNPSGQIIAKPYSSWGAAVNMLVAWNDSQRPLNAATRAAKHRLQQLGQLDKWGMDIFFKAFLDIDEVFFGRSLRDNVYLCWTFEDCRAVAYTETRIKRNRNKVTIKLNGFYFPQSGFTVHDGFSTLMHECIHAYLKLWSPRWRDFVELVDPRKRNTPGHGDSFQQCMRAIQARLGPTRFLRVDLGGEDQVGGTVSLGSDLRFRWDIAGSLMVKGERSEPFYDYAWRKVLPTDAEENARDPDLDRWSTSSIDERLRRSDERLRAGS